MKLEEQYTKMCMEVLRHRFLYYVLSETEISDQAYDKLESALKAFETKHPDLVHPETPTKNVGSSIASTYPRSIQHLYKDKLFRMGYGFDKTNRRGGE